MPRILALPAGHDDSPGRPRLPCRLRPILSRMRLSIVERRAVESASREALPAGTRVLLFGSRLDDNRRGGDIDLLVELPEPLSADDVVNRRTRFTARLYRLLEERRIDVVMTQQGSQDRRAVVTAARQQGVELART
jgi:uncharacterized protein